MRNATRDFGAICRPFLSGHKMDVNVRKSRKIEEMTEEIRVEQKKKKKKRKKREREREKSAVNQARSI